jgi:WD40 repeat protein
MFGERKVLLWRLPATGSSEVRTFDLPSDPPPGQVSDLAFDRRGRYLIVSTYPGDNTWIVSLDGSPPRRLSEDSNQTILSAFAFSPTGRYVARAFYYGTGPKTLRIWDVEAGVLHLFDLPVPQRPPGSTSRPNGFEGMINALAFLDDSTLYTAGDGGLRRWNLETGRAELVRSLPGSAFAMAFARGPQVAIVGETRDTATACDPVAVFELARSSLTPLPQFGSCVGAFDLDPTGQVVAAAEHDGTLRVGRRDGSEPYVLLGHKGFVRTVTISPDLNWIASAGEDAALVAHARPVPSAAAARCLTTSWSRN